MKRNDQRAKAGEKGQEGGCVFTTGTGRPVEPRTVSPHPQASA